jgi:hypothetical protein
VEESFIAKVNKLTEIYVGWKNLVFPNEKIEILAKKRIAICVENDCGNLLENNKCALCGCYMPAKTRNPKCHCDLKKW